MLVFLLLSLKLLVYSYVRGMPDISHGEFFVFSGDTHEYSQTADNFLSGNGWIGDPENTITYHPEGRIYGYPLFYLLIRLCVDNPQTIYNIMAYYSNSADGLCLLVYRQNIV